VGATALLLPWELKVSGEFTILPASTISVTPEVEGTLTCILAEEGAFVKPGQVLAELENLRLSNEHEETRGELAAHRASLALLLAGSSPEEIERARTQIETKRAESDSALRIEQERKIVQQTIARKQAELANAQKTYERSKLLLDEGLIARNELERDETLHEVRQKELLEAQAELKALEEKADRLWRVKQKELAQAESELKVLLAGSRKEAIAAMAAQVAKLEEKSKILGRQVQKLKVRSPIEGVVTTPYLHNRKGEHLRVGQALCEIVSVGAMVVEMPVPEKEISDVKPGYPLTMKVRGYPQLSFQAQVSEVSPVAVAKGAERTVVVRGRLENGDGALKSGMTGVGKILCGERKIADLLTRRAVRWLRTEFWEYLP
jgi:multidrug resistance efflux pump